MNILSVLASNSLKFDLINPMKTETTLSIPISIATIVVICSAPHSLVSQDAAKGAPMFRGNFLKVSATHSLKQNIYTLDTLADQMVFRYGLGLRSRRDCQHCVDLHKQMKRHAQITNYLVKACRGNDLDDFEKAINAARQSVDKLQELAKKAEVGESVLKMITKSGPIMIWVQTNTDQFSTEPLLDPGKLFKKLKSGGPTSA